MRISDWSSDVCSSDLERPVGNRERVSIGLNRRLASAEAPHSPQEDVPSADKVRATVSAGYAEAWRRAGKEDDRRRKRLWRLGCSIRSEEHTSELQSLMRTSYAVCCLQQNKTKLT